jgi:hypothetical protein
LKPTPVSLGAAYVGIRTKGPAIVPGSERQLTFGGSGLATVAAGALVISDSVTLDVKPLADLAVTLYLPGEIPPGFQITGRYARQTNYISPPGNFAAAITMPVGKITDEWFFVSGIDVLARLARELPGGSGPYSYAAAAFGPGVGFIVAWSFWISSSCLYQARPSRR